MATQSCPVRVTRIEGNKLNLVMESARYTRDKSAMLALLQAWRNMPAQIHFPQLVVSAAAAKELHHHAAYFAELDRVSRMAWNGARFVPRKEYEGFGSRVLRANKSGVSIKLLSPQRRYALQSSKSRTEIDALVRSEILAAVKIDSSQSAAEYQITFRDAGFFDFLRAGMAWIFHPDGELCPVCFCVESRVEVEKKNDFIPHLQDARNLSGNEIDTAFYQCSACGAKWEQTKYSWYSDFTY